MTLASPSDQYKQIIETQSSSLPSPLHPLLPGASPPSPPRFRRRTLRPELFYPVSAASSETLLEISLVSRPVVVTVAQIWPNGQPARPDTTVPPKHVQSSPAQTEVLGYVEHLHWLVQAANLGLLVNNEIDVHVGVDEVAVSGPAHGALDAHQAVLLGSAEDGLRVHDGSVFILDICPDPADVFTPPEAPVLQAESAQVEAVTAAAPEKHEAPAGADLPDIEGHDLVPVPELGVGHPVGPTVLLQGRLNDDRVKLTVQLLQVVILQVRLQVHRGVGSPGYQVIFKSDQFLQLRVFFKPPSKT